MCPKALARNVFSHSDWPHDEHVVGVGEKPQRGQLGPQLLVVADRGGVVPGVQLHLGIQVGGLGAAGGGLAVAAGDLVGQQHLQEVVMRQPVGPGQGEPFGEGIEQLAELEPAHQRFEVWGDFDRLDSRLRPGGPGS
jgi:hypothetical protein